MYIMYEVVNTTICYYTLYIYMCVYVCEYTLFHIYVCVYIQRKDKHRVPHNNM